MKPNFIFILLVWATVVLILIAIVIAVYDIVHGRLDGRTALAVVITSAIAAICIAGAVGQIESRQQ